MNDANQRECFLYDDVNRLTRGFTGNDQCTTPDGTRGTNEYDHTFAYNAVGNFTSAMGRPYVYGDPVHRHAATQVGSDGFTYDANGAQIGRTVGGTGALLGYDHLNRLTTVASATTSNSVYDAENNRILRKEGTTRTLYLDGGNYQRTSVNGATATVMTQYRFGSQKVAARKGASLYFQLADHLASTTTTYKSDGSSTAKQRYYPFGGIRPGPSNSLPVDEAYLGKPRDPSSGLVLMGSRYYDASIGRFISADPLAGQTDPQSLNPYSYSQNNPVTLSDPTGLCTGWCSSLGITNEALWYWRVSQPGFGRSSCLQTFSCSAKQIDKMGARVRLRYVAKIAKAAPKAKTWLNAVQGVIDWEADEGVLREGNYMGIVNANIVLGIQDGFANAFRGATRTSPGAQEWAAFFEHRDVSPRGEFKESARLWGVAEQAATEGGVARAAAKGANPSLQAQNFFNLTETARSVIREGLPRGKVAAAVAEKVNPLPAGDGVLANLMSDHAPFDLAGLGDPRNRDPFHDGADAVWDAAGLLAAEQSYAYNQLFGGLPFR